MSDAKTMLELLQASSCFRDDPVCAMLPYACAETLARAAAPSVPVEMRERIAQIVYDAFPFTPEWSVPIKPKWHPNGNSIRQDDARRAADAILAALPQPPAAQTGMSDLLWPPNEMADLMDALARSADRHTNSYTETAHLARHAANTIRALAASDTPPAAQTAPTQAEIASIIAEGWSLRRNSFQIAGSIFSALSSTTGEGTLAASDSGKDNVAGDVGGAGK